MKSGLKMLVTALVSAGVFPAQPLLAGPLVSQTVLGNERICVYGTDGIKPLPGSKAITMRVAIGEPCPIRYVSDPVPLPDVPDDAKLVDTRVRERTLVCIYSRAGKIYEVAAPKGRSCSAAP